jgi:DNA-binding Xre family transcriptional regulator
MRTFGKLREEIRKKFKNLGEIADAVGIDRSTLSMKINGKTAFRQDEIEKICKLLNISIEQVYDYFFYE